MSNRPTYMYMYIHVYLLPFFVTGRYGSAIMEYFSFVKWLFLLNCFITLLTLPIIVPNFINRTDVKAGKSKAAKLTKYYC